MKRGQITIFIIIAIFIVAIIILLYLFYPQISAVFGVQPKSPSEFIQTCLEDDVGNSIEVLSLQGGSLIPKFYYNYEGSNIEYLCYTSAYYERCVMQQPMLKEHVEEEIEKSIKNEAKECFDGLKKSYEKSGYSVSLKEGEMNVELLPKRVVVLFNNSLTLTKEESEKYELISAVFNNNLYELVSIANSILNWEARYGDAETTLYMNYYHDLKVEKKKQTDGTTIYILTDRNNGNKFQFASRSVAWPPGYGVGQVTG